MSPRSAGVPAGFAGDPDVMDTWATSSLTPQIAGQAGADDELFAKVFPMDLRPQAHDIIRTWLFTTILRSHLDHDALPWSDAAISGWVLDPDRKKMSKSKGNVVTPMHLLEEYGADAVRYWAASGRPGHRHGLRPAADEGRAAPGGEAAERLQVRARATCRPQGETLTDPLDRAMVARLADVVEGATSSFEEYDYARALERTEALLLVVLRLLPRARQGPPLRPRAGCRRVGQPRAAQSRCRSSSGCSRRSCRSSTEEVWSWWQAGSVHRAAWPAARRAAETRRPAGGARERGDRAGGHGRRAQGGAQGEVRGPSADARAGRARARARHGRAPGARSSWVAGDLLPAGAIERLEAPSRTGSSRSRWSSRRAAVGVSRAARRSLRASARCSCWVSRGGSARR